MNIPIRQQPAARGVAVRDLGRRDYVPIWRAMQQFTDRRTNDTADEIWLVEHDPIFTLGQAGKSEHLLSPGDIPVVHVDRGGQVTYHGPGQLVVYLLLDVRRLGSGPRKVVTAIENAVIKTLSHWNIHSFARSDAPGVYIGDAKIAALGLRFRRMRSYHGLALNFDMDLEPFSRINPCGYRDLAVTQLREHCTPCPDRDTLVQRLLDCLLSELECRQANEEPFGNVPHNNGDPIR